MTTVARSLLLLVILAHGVASADDATREQRPSTVILLSWDGVRTDYLRRGSLPALERMLEEGSSAERLLPAFPSITFPNHVTLATGAPVDRHGIVANRFWDPERGEYDYSNDASWIQAEPLWASAERQGVRSAVFFWVGSETPWRGTAATHRMRPFDSSVPESAKVDRIFEWLDLPEAERPRLLMAWWRGADHAGHRHGPDSEEVNDSLRAQDAQLGRLLRGLDERSAWASTTLLIVSDHGMVAAGDRLDARATLRDAGIAARVIHSSAIAHVHLEDPDERKRAIALLDAADGVRAYASDALPAHYRYAHPTRTGHVVALATPPLVFGRSGARGIADRVARLLSASTGAHGYDVGEVPEMAGIFLAMGRGVRAGRTLPEARSIDVAPTVAELLGIEPPAQSEGRALPLE